MSIEAIPIPPDSNFELQLNAMELSMMSLALTNLYGMMILGTRRAEMDLAGTLITMLSVGNSPTELVDAINSLINKLNLLADHYQEKSQ